MAGSGAEWVRRCNLGRLSGLNVVLKGVTRKPLCVTACKCLCLSSGGGVLPSAPSLHSRSNTDPRPSPCNKWGAANLAVLPTSGYVNEISFP